jgi:hypothetical protein
MVQAYGTAAVGFRRRFAQYLVKMELGGLEPPTS